MTASGLRAVAAVAERLAAHGIDAVYGLMGDDTAELAELLAASDIEFVCARHENTAVTMAVGDGWAGHRLGVCLLSRGPGLTNGLTALVDAARGDRGLLVLTGDEPTVTPGRGAGPDYKALEVDALAAAAGMLVVRPTGATIITDLDRAILLAERGEVVLYSVPKDLWSATVPTPQPPIRREATPREPAPSSLRVAADLLGRAERPLILAGRGAWLAGARDALEQLAERTGAVLATTLAAQSMFSGNPYAVGVVGSFSHGAGRRLIEQADLVLAVGVSLNRYTTSGGKALPDVPVIHVDDSPNSIGRYHRADVGVLGDARLAAERLLELVPERIEQPFRTAEVARQLAEYSIDSEFEDDSTTHTIDPRTLMRRLDGLLPTDRIVVTDVGNGFGFVTPLLPVASPDHYRLSTSFAAIGLGPGTAIGAALARPDEITVGVVGDGAMLMVLGEIETLARVSPRMIVLCLNDHAYGAERHYLDMIGVASRNTVFPDSDLAAVAVEFGVEAYTIRSVADLEEIAERLRSPDGPILLDCKITAIPAPFLGG